MKTGTEWRSPRIRVETATAPSAWASYLVNGDDSGISKEERREADAFVKKVGGNVVSCDDAGFIGWSDARSWGLADYAADCQRYVFHIN